MNCRKIAFAIGLLLSTPAMFSTKDDLAKQARMVRKSQYEVADCIINRWSPRAMSGKAISHDELMSLFEAARWAPSSYNGQPWTFLYATRGSKNWNTFLNLLVDFNKEWAQHAAVLMVVVTRTAPVWSGEPTQTYAFDTGAAWQNLALQASMNGLVAHGMGGFDYERAKNDLQIPEGYVIQAMAAIGRPGKKENLPLSMQENEKPSTRKKIKEFAFEGAFPQPSE